MKPIVILVALRKELPKHLNLPIMITSPYKKKPKSPSRIIILITGIGFYNATVASYYAINKLDASQLINIGCCGTSNPKLKIGAITFAKHIGVYPLQKNDMKFINTETKLIHQIDYLKVPVLVSSDKAILTSKNSFLTIDMEAYPIFNYAKKKNIPSSAIKVVSDYISHDSLKQAKKAIPIIHEQLALILSKIYLNI